MDCKVAQPTNSCGSSSSWKAFSVAQKPKYVVQSLWAASDNRQMPNALISVVVVLGLCTSGLVCLTHNLYASTLTRFFVFSSFSVGAPRGEGLPLAFDRIQHDWLSAARERATFEPASGVEESIAFPRILFRDPGPTLTLGFAFGSVHGLLRFA